MGAARGLPPGARVAATWASSPAVSVNLSARQFRQEGLVRSVSRRSSRRPASIRPLEMELTESW